MFRCPLLHVQSLLPNHRGQRNIRFVYVQSQQSADPCHHSVTPPIFWLLATGSFFMLPWNHAPPRSLTPCTPSKPSSTPLMKLPPPPPPGRWPSSSPPITVPKSSSSTSSPHPSSPTAKSPSP